jgi:hypothetical protein
MGHAIVGHSRQKKEWTIYSITRAIHVVMWWLLFAGIVQAAPILDQEHAPVGNFGVLAVANDRTQIQTFTVGVTGVLTRVDVQVGGNPQTVEDLILSLWSTDGTGLPKDLLATASAPPSTTHPNFPRPFITFDLSMETVAVAAGDLLAIALNSDAPNNPPFFLERYVWEIGGQYTRGTAYTKIGSSFFEQSEDLHFRTYVIVGTVRDQFNSSWNELQNIFSPIPKSVGQIEIELEIAGTAMSTARVLSGSTRIKTIQMKRDDLTKLFEDFYGLFHLIVYGVEPLIPPFLIICPRELFVFCPVDGDVAEFTASAFQIFEFDIIVRLDKDSPKVFNIGDRFVSNNLLVGSGLSFNVVEVKEITNDPDFRILKISIEGISEDGCPHSDFNQNVIIDECDSEVMNYLLNDGCTIKDLIDLCTSSANNHGNFVSCVADVTNNLQKDGIITGRDKGSIQRCAAQANIP